MCSLKLFAFSLLIVVCFQYAATTEESFDKLKKCLLEDEYDVAAYDKSIRGPYFIKLQQINAKNIYKRSDVPYHVYNQLNWQWNSLYGEIRPMAYLWAANATEVRKAVMCCMSLNISIVAKSGGHSYTKSSFGNKNSLVVDMTRMDEIKIDRKEMTVEIGAGARLGVINERLSFYKFVVPVSTCPTVGISGFTLGGGYGYFARKYGLASDNLVEMEMIDAKGRQLKVNNESYTMMWWALRGAGANAFGIVTKFKFRIHPAPTSVIYGRYEYKLSDFEQLFSAWQIFLNETKNHKLDNFGSSIALKNRKIFMEIYYMNFNVTLNPKKKTVFKYNVDMYLQQIGFPETAKSVVEELTYDDFLLKTSQHYFDEPQLKPLKHTYELNVTQHNEVGWKKVKSFYVDRLLSKEKIQAIKELLDVYAEHVNLAFFQNGGAIDNFRRTDTAFVHRYQLYDVQLWIFSPDGDDLQKRELMDRSMKEFYDRTKGNIYFGHKESYQNYLDGDDKVVVGRYYQENLSRLISLKKEWDPSNIFYHPQAIPNEQGSFRIPPELFFDGYQT